MNESGDRTRAEDSSSDVDSSRENTQEKSGPIEPVRPPEPAGKRPVRPKDVRIVGIGASAGGLEPLEQLFDNMPIDSGLAFVVVQHLSPDFRSMMDELLTRHSSMAIYRVDDGMSIEPNAVYLNPPRQEMTISNGRLQLAPLDDMGTLSLPIDVFFKSLAEDRGSDAIGVILSGTGSDGTRGAEAINAANGTVIVQEPSTAKFDSMPRTAIGKVGSAVRAAPADIPDIIMAHIGGADISIANREETLAAADPVQAILYMLRDRFGADFGYYKTPTVERRIKRRALMRLMGDVDDYALLLRTDTDELESLYHDLLIGVTAFFRDSAAFKAIEKDVIPMIAKEMSAERQIRVWIPGCASGEEAYSFAILFSEYARIHGKPLNVKILATDIHNRSLEAASAGLYLGESLMGLGQERIDRYFEFTGEYYQIDTSLRRLVVFSPHNVLRDPPFTRMDMVSCRNLLIYFKDIAQRKVLSLFHFALRKDGILFLGPSETTGELADEFATVDQRWRIFQKRRDVRLANATHMLLPSEGSSGGADTDEISRLRERAGRPYRGGGNRSYSANSSLSLAYDALLKKYAPVSLLIDRNGELLHVFGDATRFLSVGRGVFSQKAVDLVHPDLRLVVSTGIDRARTRRLSSYSRNVPVKVTEETAVNVSVTVDPLPGDDETVDNVLVLFEEHDDQLNVPDLPLVEEDDSEAAALLIERVRDLERDLHYTEESLQSTIEELETSNEELQATNEELMASNEELQSTNEELHSVNEELYTVSAEHQRKIEELTELTNDMDNFLQSTDIGTIFLDSDRRIRRFTPAIGRTFNLLARDIGRPIEHVTYRFEFDGLVEQIDEVQASKKISETGISVGDKRFLLRILPYWVDPEEAAGAVLTVVDISELAETQQRLVQQKLQYEAVVQQQAEIVCRFRPDTTFTFVNAACCQYYNRNEEDLIGTKYVDLVPEEQREELMESIANLSMGGAGIDEREDVTHDGRTVWLQWDRTAVRDENGDINEIQAVGRDITELRNVRAELEAERRRFEDVVLDQTDMIVRYQPDTTRTFVNDAYCRYFGETRESVLGTPYLSHFESDEAKDRFKGMLASIQPGETDILEMEYKDRPGGGTSWVEWRITAFGDAAGNVVTFQSIGRDITDHKLKKSVLERMQEITSDVDRDVDEKILALLQIGMEQFALASAVVLRRTEDGYDVVQSTTPAGDLPMDAINRIGLVVREAGRVVGVHNVPQSDVAGADEVAKFGVEAFLAAPIEMHGGGRVGKLCFIGRSPIRRPFSQWDLEFIVHLSTLIGSLLGYESRRAELQTEVNRRREVERMLEQQIAMLERSNSDLEQFAYIASHDLQEPLRHIETASSFLIEEYGDRFGEEAREFIEISSQGASRMRALIQDLLSFSKVGMSDFSRVPTDLNEPLGDAVEALTSVIEENGATIEARELPTVAVEATLIRQLFQNLIGNAIKYRSDEPPHVVIAAEEQEDEWVISVSDNGIGIDPKYDERIFEIFQRLHGKSEYSGTGMGLSICKRIVERHNGHIWLDVSHEKGSRFCFSLSRNVGLKMRESAE